MGFLLTLFIVIEQVLEIVPIDDFTFKRFILLSDCLFVLSAIVSGLFKRDLTSKLVLELFDPFIKGLVGIVLPVELTLFFELPLDVLILLQFFGLSQNVTVHGDEGFFILRLILIDDWLRL